MKSYLKFYEWAESLTECGPMNEVGAGMIDLIKEKIREAYKNGFSDGQKKVKPAKVSTSRNISGRRFLR